jgi:nucleoside-diphosphate-sugar epimerase
VDATVPGHDIVFHFCDDSDIRSAAEHPDTYVEQNILGLFYVLEAIRKNKIRRFYFPAAPRSLASWPIRRPRNLTARWCH